MPKHLTESHRLAAESTGGKSGRLSIGLITPGWGSSGYYSPKVLENAADAKVFPKGTHMYFDHPSESEEYDRPERSVRDLAAVLEEDATWDGEKLVGEAQVFGPYVELFTDPAFAEAIGVSIRALAEFTLGEAEGRKGRIVTELIEGESVDFVTHAGRGGSILAVLESARPERVVARAVGQGVEEATANDTRDMLARALREEFGGPEQWAWLRDFDESTAFFQWETPDSSGTYAVPYTLGTNTASLDSEGLREVRARTEYVPVTDAAENRGPTHLPAPAGGPTTSPASPEEDTIMGTKQVDEGEFARLTEAAGRVATLESERDAAVQRAESAEQERDTLREAQRQTAREAKASELIDAAAKDAEVTFTALERRGLLAALPLTEKGDLDEDAFTESVRKDATAKAEESGAGAVRGFGLSTPATPADDDAIKAAEAAAAGAFGRTVKEG